MSVIEEFKAFIMKGDVIDLAVGVVMGLAFNAVVTAFITDIITPLIGVAGKVNFATLTYTVNGSTFLVGTFVNALISFVTLAIVVFFFLVKPVTKMKEFGTKKKPAPATTKQCPECLSTIPLAAKRCAFCTSKL